MNGSLGHSALAVLARLHLFKMRLKNIAKQTTGFSGADLANLLNECAIRAVKDGDGTITNEITENVYQRIVVGAKGDVKYSFRKKELVAYHEAGHAIVGVLVPDYDKVRKVSIMPRGAAGGGGPILLGAAGLACLALARASSFFAATTVSFLLPNAFTSSLSIGLGSSMFLKTSFSYESSSSSDG